MPFSIMDFVETTYSIVIGGIFMILISYRAANGLSTLLSVPAQEKVGMNQPILYCLSVAPSLSWGD